MAQDTGKYCFGVEDTLRGLELGAVETLIVWENLDVTRHRLRDSNGAEIIVHTHAPPPTAANNAKVDGGQSGINGLSAVDREKFIDKTTGLEMEQAGEPMNLLEWFSEHYKEVRWDFPPELLRRVWTDDPAPYSSDATLSWSASLPPCGPPRSLADSRYISQLQVTNRSQEGSQFVRGFGGIGGILRYKVDFLQIADAIDDVCHFVPLS